MTNVNIWVMLGELLKKKMLVSFIVLTCREESPYKINVYSLKQRDKQIFYHCWWEVCLTLCKVHREQQVLVVASDILFI